MAHVLSVNVGAPKPNPHKDVGTTGIDKLPVTEPVDVRAPGPKRGGQGSGMVGDFIGDRQNHGGDDQAVYAYAREDLDHWQRVLGRDLRPGSFGENLTTVGVDVNGARIGERWRIGSTLLEVSVPRIPCSTFAGWLAERGWIKTFTRGALPGAYLRVVTPGQVRAGDEVVVLDRPDHDVTIALTFRALTLEPELLQKLLAADALPAGVHDRVRRRQGFQLDDD